MVDATIAALAARKYDIQQQQADSATRLANAQSQLTNTQAGLLPSEAAARNYELRGSGAQAFGSANLANTNASLAPGIASSESGLRGAQASDLFASARSRGIDIASNPNIDLAATLRYFGANGARAPGGAAPFSYASPGIFDIDQSTQAPLSSQRPDDRTTNSGFNFSGGVEPPRDRYDAEGRLLQSTGTDRVPGRGSGKVDTVPAMLAPGEAVLNRGAAEHLGRDTIALLNAIGARRMGLAIGDDSDTSHPATGSNAGVDNQTGKPTGTGYASGTADVGGWRDPAQDGDSAFAPVQMAPRYADDHKGVPPTRSSFVDPRTRSANQPRPPWMHHGGHVTMGEPPPEIPFMWSDGRPQYGNIPDQPEHYSNGTSNVGSPPAPGQTITSGTWTPAPPPFNPRAATGILGVPRPGATPKPGQQAPGYAKGTANVQPKKMDKSKSGGMSRHAAAHTPDGSGLSPGILQALLSMGQGGGPPGGAPGGMPGGMPQPGAMPPPMPMAMPPLPQRR